MQKAKTYLCEHVFNPHSILEKMDLVGGICNLKAYMVILNVKRDAKDPLRDFGKDATILPHKWQIRHASKLANMYADTLLPMKHSWRMCRISRYHEVHKKKICCIWT